MSESKCSIEQFSINDSVDSLGNGSLSDTRISARKLRMIIIDELIIESPKVTITGELRVIGNVNFEHDLQVNGYIHSDKTITDDMGNSNHHNH